MLHLLVYYFFAVLLTSASIHSSPVDEDFVPYRVLGDVSFGYLPDGVQPSVVGRETIVEAPILDLLAYQYRMRFMGNVPKKLAISFYGITVDGKEVCRNAKGRWPTYQKTKDGTLWYTNCDVGFQLSQSEIARFKEKINALKAKLSGMTSSDSGLDSPKRQKSFQNPGIMEENIRYADRNRRKQMETGSNQDLDDMRNMKAGGKNECQAMHYMSRSPTRRRIFVSNF